MKIPYELITIDLSKGEQKVPSFIEKQPFGQVPYLDDNGFIVFESRAICRYLAMKYKDQGPNLLPDFNDLESTALFEQAVSIEGSNFDAFAYPAVAEMVFKPRRGITPNPATFQSLVEQLDAKLKGYEYILGKQKYLGGNQLTVADLYHLPYGSMLAVAGSDVITREGRPNFTRWWNELTSRESWKAISGPQGVPVKNDF
ncbi:glutathione S-transferase [Marasmius fiardii PR-910]|nr:glutathione S-transferase [Marasmius fiardii PR-910]